EKVGLTPWADERLSRLSGGMLQRALLATAVVHRPPLLILDEPSAGLDPSQRVGLRTILRELNPGGAVLLSTHILEDVAALADDALIMKEGSIKFAGPVRGSTETSAQGSLSHVSELESAYLEIVG